MIFATSDRDGYFVEPNGPFFVALGTMKGLAGLLRRRRAAFVLPEMDVSDDHLALFRHPAQHSPERSAQASQIGPVVL